MTLELRLRLILLLLALLAAVGCDRQKPPEQQGDAAAGVPTNGVDRTHKGQAAPDVSFKDPEGGDITLSDFEGVPVLVNLWATWCAPCVKELPTLNRLAVSHNEEGQLGVVAVSQDMGPQGSVAAFLDKLGVQAIGPYHDPKMGLSSAIGANVLPTTILYDAQGKEVWRYVGDLDWSGDEAAKLLADSGAAARP